MSSHDYSVAKEIETKSCKYVLGRAPWLLQVYPLPADSPEGVDLPRPWS